MNIVKPRTLFFGEFSYLGDIEHLYQSLLDYLFVEQIIFILDSDFLCATISRLRMAFSIVVGACYFEGKENHQLLDCCNWSEGIQVDGMDKCEAARQAILCCLADAKENGYDLTLDCLLERVAQETLLPLSVIMPQLRELEELGGIIWVETGPENPYGKRLIFIQEDWADAASRGMCPVLPEDGINRPWKLRRK